MGRKTLLRKHPYNVTFNQKSRGSVRINLNEKSGFKQGALVYQVLRNDGVLELVPEIVFLGGYLEKK
jgi:hypothetical protein